MFKVNNIYLKYEETEYLNNISKKKVQRIVHYVQ